MSHQISREPSFESLDEGTHVYCPIRKCRAAVMADHLFLLENIHWVRTLIAAAVRQASLDDDRRQVYT